ncbi:hypothetical protein MBLNU457_g0256t1 [Dothideomycetes sp. NU457]
MDPKLDQKTEDPLERRASTKQGGNVEEGVILNASGHQQELSRNFNFLSICSVGIVTGNSWTAIGGSIVVALYNGGAPGVIYEFIAVSVFYWIIAASIAELASAIPSSAGVYHWASVTGGPKWGKSLSWFAGWWNFFAWVFGAASVSLILANQVLTMYNLFHPDYAPERWHVFVVYVIMTWTCALTVMFANRGLPTINNIGLFLILAGVLTTILICAIMPSTTHSGHATNAAVWTDWNNSTGWPSGFAFLAGMLNGAYAVGTPDCISHLAEEIPKPRSNLPKAIAAQMATGFLTGLFYLIALSYSIHDFDAVLRTPYLNPLGEVYAQATSSRAGACGLMVLIFLPNFCTCIGDYITAGRMLYTLARDDATPFSGWTGKIHPRFQNPFNATLACAVICTVLAAIYVGSATAFNAFVGSFVVLSTASYLAAIAPHLLSGRRFVTPGPFWMKGWLATVVHGVSCAYIAVFIVIFCFPYA